jgi:acid phosphatase family membrane protein YuiD
MRPSNGRSRQGNSRSSHASIVVALVTFTATTKTIQSPSMLSGCVHLAISSNMAYTNQIVRILETDFMDESVKRKSVRP